MSKKLTTEEFIRRSKLIHGDKYDYSKSVYVNPKTKICIICPIHGEFYQSPYKHMSGQGCSKCYHTSWNVDLFLKEAKNKYNNKFDYSKAVFTGMKNPICIICPIHGEFWQTPEIHLRKDTIYGCKQCSYEALSKSMTLSSEDFIKKSIAVHGEYYDYSLVEYKNAHEKVEIICPIHGIFSQSPTSHLSGSGCPKCFSKELMTTEKFKKISSQKHNNFYIYEKSEYKPKEKICITCPNHGDFLQDPYAHMNGAGCPLCAKERNKGVNLKGTEEFIKEAIEIHGDKYDYSLVEYKGRSIPVKIICPIHGEFYQQPAVHLRKDGHGCPLCGMEASRSFKVKDVNLFINQSNEIHNNFYDYSKVEYVNSNTPVVITCPIHGDFPQAPSSHLSGRGCPKCSAIGISNLECDVFKFIEKIQNQKIVQNTKSILNSKLELDIFIPDLNIAFEFNGIYWHSTEFKPENKYKHLNKTKLCEEKGIKLFHIWESDWLENRSEVEDRIKKIFDTRSIEIPKDDIVEIDRSWPEFDKDEMEYLGYELVEEVIPSNFCYKGKHTLFDCGKLIYKKVLNGNYKIPTKTV